MRTIKNFALVTVSVLMLMSLTTAFIEAGPTTHTQVSTTGTKVTWVKDSHDFGEIAQGVPVSVEFAFTNNGDEALTIAEVITSCGCTASDYPKEAIAPGRSSKINVSFNAKTMGTFSKTITVKSNDKDAKVLTIKGVVK
jgi:hypothetical protein